MTKKTGFAALTASTQYFLDTCPAVLSWTTIARGVQFARDTDVDGIDNLYIADLVTFEYDPTVEVSLIPQGVDFSEDGAISEYVPEIESS